MAPDIHERCRQLLTELALAGPDDKVRAEPLSGGVASDIARVSVGDQTYCVKFALPKLKVAADWFAPVHRNAAEYAWLRVAAQIAPESAVRLIGRSPTQHGFVMEYVSGEDVYLWKTNLLEKAPDQGEATQVGALIGQIHQASCAPGFDPAPFHNRDDFRALRLEPYLTFTATHHPDLQDHLHALAEQLYQSQQVLVHGDVSPKNIVFRASGPVILDAECASLGDASFDPAFCINHLVLKAIHLPGARQRFLDQAVAWWQAYEPNVSWETAADVEMRVCRLLPALMLGRVDGKSPVEYLDSGARDQVRHIARHYILNSELRLEDLISGIADQLKENSA